MAYCRVGADSDVYCFHSIFGGWEVYWPTGYANEPTETGAIGRLETLKSLGYKVPERAIERLKREKQK